MIAIVIAAIAMAVQLAPQFPGAARAPDADRAYCATVLDTIKQRQNGSAQAFAAFDGPELPTIESHRDASRAGGEMKLG